MMPSVKIKITMGNQEQRMHLLRKTRVNGFPGLKFEGASEGVSHWLAV